MEKIFTVRLSADEKAVEILDQTLLPNRVEYLRLETAEQYFGGDKGSAPNEDCEQCGQMASGIAVRAHG